VFLLKAEPPGGGAFQGIAVGESLERESFDALLGLAAGEGPEAVLD